MTEEYTEREVVVNGVIISVFSALVGAIIGFDMYSYGRTFLESLLATLILFAVMWGIAFLWEYLHQKGYTPI